MSKLNLVAMAYDKDVILNALQKTGAAEIKLHAEAENTVPLKGDGDKIRALSQRAENSLQILCAAVSDYEKQRKLKSEIQKDGFDVSYSEFFSAKQNGPACEQLITQIEELSAFKASQNALITKLTQASASAEPYKNLTFPLNTVADTAHTCAKLGALPAAALNALLGAAEQAPLAAVNVLFADSEVAAIAVFYHKRSAGLPLQDFGFTPCPFSGERSGAEIYKDLQDKITAAKASLDEADEKFYALRDKIRELKIYCDFLGFELEKAELGQKMRATQVTFLLEAYVPEEAEEGVKAAVTQAAGAVYYQFSTPAEDEIPPTLYKNNAVVKNFETITNMYSPSNSREFDPNAVMAVFYSIFLGFIMADIGYGLIMFLGGGAIYLKLRAKDNGLKRLSGVFAIGGICAILWGLLFGSLFGISIMPAVMPNAQKDMWHFMGIAIPAVLIISLEIGIVQLLVGYVCKSVQSWRRGGFLSGFFEGIPWAVFSLGVGLAIVGLVEEANLGILATVGGIIAGVSLLVAILTAGRGQKILGKFTKGFGAAYGVINYASDILSYARLYGLLLSGAVIAEIVSRYSVDFITGGNILFAILGVILMIVGHAFNLAMGLLGAYIHDARLQYVEFYGRFFEGEGELFKPLGSGLKYVNLKK